MKEELFIKLMPLTYMFMEALGSILFFDTFLELRRSKKYRFATVFILILVTVSLGKRAMWIKLVLVALSLILPAHFFYKASWGKCLFLSLAYYSILYLCDFLLILLIDALKLSWNEDFYAWSFLIFLEKLACLCVLLGIRAFYKKRKNRKETTDCVWFKLCIIPLFTIASLVALYLQDGMVNNVSTGSAAVLVIVNIVFIILVQSILEEQKKVREQDAGNRKILNQLAVYHDMQALYDRQNRKMHDYKKQLTAIQALLAENHIEEAEKLLVNLNGSIAADMSAVNTNHHTVNAVLNQEIAKAKEKGIPVMLKINDLQEVKLKEDDIVILLSNLLDNAVTACEKVLKEGKKPVIHLKLELENGSLLCAVKNPVTERVKIVNNVVQAKAEPGHGLGLLNVKELADRYDGELILSCDEKEFSAVVML